MKHAVEMRNIVKRFPGVLANNCVNLAVEAGEIHALLGENGAGKTTLMQVLYGFYAMDSGEILVNGRAVHLSNPNDAIALGIGMVHQEFMLVQSFSVVENTVLGLREGFGPLLNLEQASQKLKALSDHHGLSLDPRAQVQSLPIGLQQRVEILKLLYRDARILILDEPTAVLGKQEKDNLFAVLRELRSEGRSILIATHKLNEVMEIADRVTVMRDGHTVATRTIGTREKSPQTASQELTRLMVGRDMILRAQKTPMAPGKPVLEIQNLRVSEETGQEKVCDVSLTVRAGEIFGIAGVEGNGQSQLAQAILHLRAIKSGRVLLNGIDVTKRSVAQHRLRGLAYIPSDRRHVGSIAEMSIADNAILGFQTTNGRGLFRSNRFKRSARSLVDRFHIRGPSLDLPASTLSGGNLQKLIVGREIMRGADALIAEHPTRGLDVAAVESMWQELIRQRQEGKAILLISSELSELLNLADRIAVMFEGQIMAVLDAAKTSPEEIGSMMAGISRQDKSAFLASPTFSKENKHGEAI